VGNAWAIMLTTLKRERFLTITNLAVMSITFLVLGIFISVVFASQSVLKYLESQAQVTVFFKDDFPEQNIFELKDKLHNDVRIAEVFYSSKEDAFKLFTELNKDDPILLESISASIFPASLELKTKKLADLAILADELAAVDGVEDVRFFREVVEKFRYTRNVIYIVGSSLGLLFLVISYSVVIATLRLTITAKSAELEIQKLVGASDDYICAPLIAQGLFFGILSASIASLVLFVIAGVGVVSGTFTAGLFIPFLYSFRIHVLVFTALLSIILLFSGGLLGYIGSKTAIRNYLRY